MSSSCSSSEIKEWLKSALCNENLTDFLLEIVGNSEKGDGYIGDIIFVNLKAITSENLPKVYNLVLKCGKRSQKLRESAPVRETFENEIYMYTEVLNSFNKFQKERGSDITFRSMPKCYGTFIGDNTEILALENLKLLGYSLYDRKKPLTLDHINLVVGEYGKWHAISVAMQDQQPEEFLKLISGLKDPWKKFGQIMDLEKFFGSPVDEVCVLLQYDIDEEIKERLGLLKNQILYIMNELIYEKRKISIICHGDCWNNNFMFKYEDSNPDRPVKVAMLDWQVSRFANPVTDLSYFIYACISSDDLENFDDILKTYYYSFTSSLKKLGSNPEELYTYADLLCNWKVFSKFGVMMALLAIKIAVTDKEEIADITTTVESGSDLSDTFAYEIKNKDLLKKRVLGLVNHAVRRGFI